MLPNGWKKVKLGDIAIISSGSTPLRSNKAYFDNGNIPWVKTMDLTNGKITKTDECITELAAKKCKPYPTGTVLVAMYGGFNQIGRTGLLTFPASINQALAALQFDKDICSEYVLFYLNANVDRWRSCAASSRKDPNITSQKKKKFKIVLPPIEEQKKIVATLSVWDSAIEKMEKLIDAKEDQKKSLIWKLIENTDTIRKEKIKIDDLFDEVCEKNHPDADVLTIIQGTGTLLREKSGRDIVYDKKSLSNYKFVKKGDFIIHLRSFEGGLEVANQDGIVSPAYIILRPKIEVSTDYLYALFHTNRFINYTISPAVEGARDGRSVKYDALKKQFINLPTFSEQKYIAKIITTAEKEHSLLKQQLEKYKKQKQGIMQKLLTGEWRVK